MQIHTHSPFCFQYKEESGAISTLTYHDDSLNTGTINAGKIYKLNLIATGTWTTVVSTGKEEKIATTIKTETGGHISITKYYRRKKYIFKKSLGLKLRFTLFNTQNEELLTLLTVMNWQKSSHDYILQLNEEFEKECDSFLILQAVHCANCSLSMMTGGKVPALVSI